MIYRDYINKLPFSELVVECGEKGIEVTDEDTAETMRKKLLSKPGKPAEPAEPEE